MRFGRDLNHNKVPLWRHEYVDYDRLKTEIKLVRARSKQGEVLPGDCESAFKSTTYQIKSINQFHKYLSNAIWGEVSKYHVWYSGPKYLEKNPNWEKDIYWEATDEPELQFFLGLLIQCHNDLKKLLWYGMVNSVGFQKILHKFGELGDELDYPDWINARIEDFRSMLAEGLFSMHDESSYRLRRVEVMIEYVTSVLSKRTFTSQSSLLVNNLAHYWYRDLVWKDGLPALDLDVACRAIREDDPDALHAFFEGIDVYAQEKINSCVDEKARMRTKVKMEQQYRKLILVLTQLSIIHVSKACLDKFLELMELDNNLGFPRVDYISWVIDGILVKMSHQQLLAEHFESQDTEQATSRENPSETNDYLLSILARILSTLNNNESRRIVLFKPDVYWAYFPIHQASRYGLPDACRLLLDHMPLVSKSQFIEPVLECRFDKSTPFTLAVAHGHTDVCDVLVKRFRKIWDEAPKNSWVTSVRNDEDVLKAIYLHTDLWQVLPPHGPFKDYQGAYGETVLYAAASSGNYSAVSCLLHNKVDVNIPEKSRGWTPLIVTSVKGYESIVKLLIEAGAKTEHRDRLGWRALEHAVSHSHMKISEMFQDDPSGKIRVTYLLCLLHL
ncbi:hypothetical protein EIK77_007167 [Talaromyces pinophilus]|nr:hypothetical protein EIK77_007167 [Talaromyces pinophilus]PCH08387.1 Hypothetical protein PENO1_007150 [Penicillium occitanis (nom. inval.)]PCH10553.1 hypothetical protein PENOC_000690 [Penicillium occitanis (nom. inval.)]